MPTQLRLYLDLIRWDRPAGWLLLLWPTLSALWVAAQGFAGGLLLLVFVLGTLLMRSAGCCFNDVADRHFDRFVKRTAQRPVTTGALSVPQALGAGVLLSLLAFGLVLFCNWQTVAWSVVALGITLCYPYAKRWVSMPQAVLGVAFSFGIPMAFSAVQGKVPALAWSLFAGNLCWVLAYDTQYAMVDRDDDLRLNIKTSALTLGSWDVAFVMLCDLLFLGIWAAVLLPRLPGPWFGLALLAALLQVVWHGWLIRQRSRAGCFQAFRQNHWLGMTLFIGVWLSYSGPG